MEKIMLAKPVVWDNGEEIAEIDLSGLESLTVMDAVEVQKQLESRGERAAGLVPETSQAYLNGLAARAAKLPVEFFDRLRIGDCRKVRLAVQIHLNSGEKKDEKPHVLVLAKPCQYKGRTVEEIDFTGVGELTSRDVCKAERMTMETGVTAAEPSVNYMYCCCVAALATGYPVEFFTGLPLVEALQLKVAVNDADFFA